MAKKRRGNKPRELTKRQLSRWQAQKKRQRIILGAGVAVIAVVLVIVLSGWYTTQYRPLHATAIKVNGAKFDMQYYIDMLRFQTAGESPQAMALIADSAIKTIEQDELIRQGALALGIVVTDDNITQKIKAAGVGSSSARREYVRTQLLIEKLKSDYFDKQVPTTASQAHIMAMLLESEQQATEVRARLEKGESFTDLAAQLSLTRVTKDKKGDLGWHPQDIYGSLLGSKVPGDYAFGSEAGTLSQPRQDTEIVKDAGYWLIKVTNRQGPNDATVSAIFLGSAQEAQQIRARLVAGEDFATLAKQYSLFSSAKDDGGNLGPVTNKQQSPAFDGYVFNPDTKVGELSQPILDITIQTKGGYWLVKVLEKADNRPIDSADRETLKNKAVQDWVASLWADPSNNIDDSYLDSGHKTWAQLQAAKP